MKKSKTTVIRARDVLKKIAERRGRPKKIYARDIIERRRKMGGSWQLKPDRDFGELQPLKPLQPLKAPQPQQRQREPRPPKPYPAPPAMGWEWKKDTGDNG